MKLGATKNCSKRVEYELTKAFLWPLVTNPVNWWDNNRHLALFQKPVPFFPRPHSKKITRLERSLFPTTEGPDELPALNHGELMTIVLVLKLNEDECLHIYAALIALGTQRLLLDYLIPQRAWEIAVEVRDAALVWLRTHSSDADIFPRRRSKKMPFFQGSDEELKDELIAEALDAYDEGASLSALGQFRGDSGRRNLLKQAELCLEHAEMLLLLVPESSREINDWQYWVDQVVNELISVREELS